MSGIDAFSGSRITYLTSLYQFLKENGIRKRHWVAIFGLKIICMVIESFGLSLLLPIGEYFISLAKNEPGGSGQVWSLINALSQKLQLTITIHHVVVLFFLSLFTRQVATFLSCRLDYYLYPTFTKHSPGYV